MKCPLCNSSKHVTCLQSGKRFLAYAASAATYVALFPFMRNAASPQAVKAGREIGKKLKYYCSDCNYEFEGDAM